MMTLLISKIIQYKQDESPESSNYGDDEPDDDDEYLKNLFNKHNNMNSQKYSDNDVDIFKRE